MTAAFVLTEDQAAWIEAQAQDQGVSKSEIIRTLIAMHRAEHTLKPPI